MSDFKMLEKSIGKTLKFEAYYVVNGNRFTDIFYAVLRDIGEDGIIVEESFVFVEDDLTETIRTQRRLLKKNHFNISREIPLNG